jgi:mono/diheme cytochrome c family protein
MTSFSMAMASRRFMIAAFCWIVAYGSPKAFAADLVNGYRRYNAGCNHCHGPDGVGSTFAPSLVVGPIDAAVFRQTVRNGKSSGAKVMKGFADDPNVAPYLEDIYAYLKARADGTLGRGRPAP